METSNKRVRLIDYLRGTAIVLVVLGHAIITYPIDLNQIEWCLILRKIIYSFHMPLFFLISGMVYKCVDYKIYYLSKVKRILIPYLIWGLLTILFHSFSGGFVSTTYSIGEGLKSLFLFGGEYWFLYTLFVILMIYPLMNRILKNNIIIIAIIIMMITMQQVFRLPYDGFLTAGAVLYYFPYFIVGDKYREFFLKKKENTIFCLVLAIVGYIALFVVIEVLGIDFTLIKYARAFCIILVLAQLYVNCKNHIENNVVGQFLETCSRYSLQIFLLNGYWLVLIRYLLCTVLKISNAFVIICAITIPTIVLTILFCKLAEKFKVGRFILGLNNNKSLN